MNTKNMVNKMLGKGRTVGRTIKPTIRRQENNLLNRIYALQKKYDPIINSGKLKSNKFWNIVENIGRPGYPDFASDFKEELEFVSRNSIFPLQIRLEAKSILQELDG